MFWGLFYLIQFFCGHGAAAGVRLGCPLLITVIMWACLLMPVRERDMRFGMAEQTGVWSSESQSDRSRPQTLRACTEQNRELTPQSAEGVAPLRRFLVSFAQWQWTVVVLTCQHKDSVYSFQRELELRQRRGSLSPGALVLTVRDRQEPLGSGGATLNALLVAAEHLSNRAGHTVVTADVLDDAHVLILHTGRDFPWSSCCRAFCWIPVENPDHEVQAPVCCLDMLLDRLTKQICPGSPPGVWVCSTDMMLSIPPDFTLSWEGFSGVRVLALPGEVPYAANHGVYLSDEQVNAQYNRFNLVFIHYSCFSLQGNVRDIIYKGTREQIQQAVMSDGKVPMVSLFLDILKCLCSDQTQHQFVNEEREGCSSVSGQSGALVRGGRTELWRILRGTSLTLVYVPGGNYDYLTLSGKDHIQRLSSNSTNKNTLSHIQTESLISDGAAVINSVLDGDVSVDSGAVVQHCHLQAGGAVVSWRAACLLGARLFPVLRPRAGVAGLEGGVSWLLRGGVSGLQSWREAWRLSLKEVMSLTHQEAELRWREELLFLSGRRRVRDALIGRSDACLLPCFRAAVMGGQQGALLETLDNKMDPQCPGAELGVSARCLSCIADVLVVMAGGKGGLRSGPAANEAWRSAYALLEEGDLSRGVQALTQQRDKWLCRPDLLVRAARHYEGAGQVLLRQAVMSSQRFISIGQGALPALEEWQEVHCPARLDLAASDWCSGSSHQRTSPPIGQSQRGRDSGVSTETLCESLEDLKDYCQPHAPGTSSILAGALLAAVYRCTGRTYDTDSLIHNVLYLEQILTTGGGWQDQVGGLVGGVKVGRSQAQLPLQVRVQQLSLSHDFLVSLEQHLLLVYTGKTRLARNLLQDVVRSWYSRLPRMVQNVQQLVANAEDCAKACLDGSLSGLGECLNRSWQQKKLMAPGCEPASVRLMMEALRPLVLGQSLAGAGGGGFMYVLTKLPRQREEVINALNNTPGLGDFSVHSVELDMEGITVVPST
ncbi:hypothetical protein WMY93_023617 [Mugilogobius chulae]|uniref:Fucose kinase n=1 Tax=Mugilogobius chulae TaxID=88201 RepID=A0AAW0NH42_9GOBI